MEAQESLPLEIAFRRVNQELEGGYEQFTQNYENKLGEEVYRILHNLVYNLLLPGGEEKFWGVFGLVCEITPGTITPEEIGEIRESCAELYDTISNGGSSELTLVADLLATPMEAILTKQELNLLLGNLLPLVGSIRVGALLVLIKEILVR